MNFIGSCDRVRPFTIRYSMFFMQPSIKRLSFCLLLIFAVVGAVRLVNFLTDGFFVSRIIYDKPFDPRFETTPPAINLDIALSQPFHYLSKGHQTYVFESQDGQYVLKFLKCHLVEIKPWLAFAPLFGKWEAWRQSRINAKQKRLESIFAAWKIAHEELPEETGILAAQMNLKKNNSQKVVIKNKIGWQSTVDLNQTAFLLQKKVDMLIPTIENHMSSSNQEKAQELLTALIDMYWHLTSIGISDSDPQIMRNTGVYHNRPILIDVGRLKKDSAVMDKTLAQKEISKKTRLLSAWLEKHYPSLYFFFHDQLNSRSQHNITSA